MLFFLRAIPSVFMRDHLYNSHNSYRYYYYYYIIDPKTRRPIWVAYFMWPYLTWLADSFRPSESDRHCGSGEIVNANGGSSALDIIIIIKYDRYFPAVKYSVAASKTTEHPNHISERGLHAWRSRGESIITGDGFPFGETDVQPQGGDVSGRVLAWEDALGTCEANGTI